MFIDPLSERDMYWLGYFRADGCLNPYRPGSKLGRAVFAQALLEPVREFKEFIGTDHVVHSRIYTSQLLKTREYGEAHIFSSPKPYLKLKELGVKVPELRSDIFNSSDFWRGMIDGDGTLGLYPQGNMLRTNVALCSPWKSDLDKFETFCLNLGLPAASWQTCRGIYSVRYRGRSCQFLVRSLYSGKYSANSNKRLIAEKIMDYIPIRERGLF